MIDFRSCLLLFAVSPLFSFFFKGREKKCIQPWKRFFFMFSPKPEKCLLQHIWFYWESWKCVFGTRKLFVSGQPEKTVFQNQKFKSTPAPNCPVSSLNQLCCLPSLASGGLWCHWQSSFNMLATRKPHALVKVIIGSLLLSFWAEAKMQECAKLLNTAFLFC